MTWDMPGVVTAVADTVQSAVGITRVYHAAGVGAQAIPPAVAEFPAVLVYPETSDPVTAYAGQLRTTPIYIDVLTGRWDVGLNVATALQAMEAIIERLHADVVLSPSARWVSYTVSWTLPIDWGGIIYVGGRIVLDVIEDQQGVLQP